MTTLLKNRVGQPPATGSDVKPYPPALVRSATAIRSETTIIEADADLYHRVATRLVNQGETVAAEDVLGPLDDTEDVLEEAEQE
jgi:hypothetical protein